MKKTSLPILAVFVVILFHAGPTLAVTERGTLKPVEVSVCMEGETHYLRNPCNEMDIVYLKIEDVDPQLIGTYVEVEGEEVGFLCEVIDVVEITLLHDQPLEDNYPPGGNDCPDICECEGNFDGDEDQDGSDGVTFKADFGRNPLNNPCDGLDIYVAGTNGAVLHYDGSTWAEMETGTTESLRDVWGSSKSDIFAVGGRTSLHYNGTSWSPITIDPSSYLLDVWGAGVNDVFVTGWDGDIFHYNGTNWLPMERGGTYFLYGIWGSAPDDVFVASYGGFIYHYNGTNWETMTSGTTQDLFAIGGTSAKDVFAVGRNGTILHYNGTSWEAMDSGTTKSLFEIWGAAPDDVYVVGSSGTILHYDGSSWLPMDSGTTTFLNGIWGSGANNIFAVGEQCTILHYDGINWSPVPGVPPVTSSLTGIWGISAIPCKGDFDCDEDVDGRDAALFKEDFGRSPFDNPCPVCEVGDLCIY